MPEAAIPTTMSIQRRDVVIGLQSLGDGKGGRIGALGHDLDDVGDGLRGGDASGRGVGLLAPLGHT